MSSRIGRKTFVTQGFERGMDDAVIMANTGHKDYRLMKPYRAIATEEKRKQMDKAWGQRQRLAPLDTLEALVECQLGLGSFCWPNRNALVRRGTP